MPYPKEYLIYCSIYNRNPSENNPMGSFNVWLINKKKEYELEKPKEDFITWLENLKPGTHPLSQLHAKEEEKGGGRIMEKKLKAVIEFAVEGKEEYVLELIENISKYDNEDIKKTKIIKVLFPELKIHEGDKDVEEYLNIFK